LQTNATYGHRMIFWRPTRGGRKPSRTSGFPHEGRFYYGKA